MALTVTIKQNHVAGARRRIVADVTFDNAYTTGGLALTRKTFGFAERLDNVLTVAAVKSDNTAACPTSYDYTNSKLQAWGTAGSAGGLTEIANGVDLSAYTARIEAVGV